jgi:hypothetical protein
MHTSSFHLVRHDNIEGTNMIAAEALHGTGIEETSVQISFDDGAKSSSLLPKGRSTKDQELESLARISLEDKPETKQPSSKISKISLMKR